MARVVDQMAGEGVRKPIGGDLEYFKNALFSRIDARLPSAVSDPIATLENFLYDNDWRFMRLIEDDLDGVRQ